MERQQLPVEVRLHAVDISVGQVLATEIHFQPLDRALDTPSTIPLKTKS